MINGKRVLAITLARGGSTKIKKKNIIPICGKPLLHYTINEVVKSKYIDRYFVSTDDEEIINSSLQYGIDFFKRSKEYASDTAKSSDALIEVVNYVKEPYYHYIVEIMCTNPLKIVEDIDGCIEKLDATGSDSVVSVSRVWDHHPSRLKYIENDRLCDFYPEILESRRQDLCPPAYVRNGSIYAMTRESLLKTRCRIGKDVRPYIMPEERSINIDEPIDLIIAEQIIKNKIIC
jgi:CMP-N,N'-diacetyllegionaminic acid synthase